MRVTEKWREMDRMTDEVGISIDNALIVSISNQTSLMVYNLNPFRFGTQYNTGFLKEESFFLHASTICHYNTCILL